MEPNAWTATTPRLVLRPVAAEDAAATAALMSLGVSARLLSWPSPMSRDEARERIVASIESREAREALDLAILLRACGSLAGWIGMRRTGTPGEATLGFWLGEAYQGCGLMSEAAPAAMPIFARLLGVSRIRASVHPANAASARILSKLGLSAGATGTAFSPVRGTSEAVVDYEGPVPPTVSARRPRS